MFCRNCGKEVQDDWKICPVCGESLKENQEEKIDDGGDEYKKDQEENLGKEFEIFDDIFYVSDGRKLVCDVRAFVTKLAIEARDEFIDTYHKLENIDNILYICFYIECIYGHQLFHILKKQSVFTLCF